MAQYQVKYNPLVFFDKSMSELRTTYRFLQDKLSELERMHGHGIRLLAVSKSQPAALIRECAELGQKAFGENYVQEALVKMAELRMLDLEWHLIGPLQSKKCRAVAEGFAWVQTIDREKIIPLLAAFRPADAQPLNVLIQVNVDDALSKSGCLPSQIGTLAESIARYPQLRLRGLMAIPQPDPETLPAAFARMQELFAELQRRYPAIDTLSMGMSDDFPLAAQFGATLVRVGSALFGQRPTTSEAL